MLISWTKLEPLPKAGLLRTVGDIMWNARDRGYYLVIPGGFYFDGASVPNWSWPLLGTNPIQMLVPGLVHDYAVRRGAIVNYVRHGNQVAYQSEVDSPHHAITIMDDAMEWAGVSEEDRRKTRVALEVTKSFYWQKKDMSWTGDYVRS